MRKSYFTLSFFLLLKIVHAQQVEFISRPPSESEFYSERDPRTEEERCTQIDYRKLMGPRRNQGKLAWCYAHASADLLQYRLKSPQISSADVAITYNHKSLAFNQRRFYNIFLTIFSPWQLNTEHTTGFMALAIKASLERGICAEENFPSDKMERVTVSNGIASRQTVPFYNGILDIQNQRRELARSSRRGRTIDESLFYIFPRIETAEEYFNILLHSKKDELFFNFSNRICHNKRFYSQHPLKIKWHVSHPHIFNVIDRELEKQNIVGFDYWMQIRTNLDAPKKGLHASTIIGRKFNHKTNQCEYLVRDSYGEDCSQYDRRLLCEDGYLWIPQNIIHKNMLDLVYIEKN